jgi:hypothetical protein
MLDAHRNWAASDLMLRYPFALQLSNSDTQRDSFTMEESVRMENSSRQLRQRSDSMSWHRVDQQDAVRCLRSSHNYLLPAK